MKVKDKGIESCVQFYYVTYLTVGIVKMLYRVIRACCGNKQFCVF